MFIDGEFLKICLENKDEVIYKILEEEGVTKINDILLTIDNLDRLSF